MAPAAATLALLYLVTPLGLFACQPGVLRCVAAPDGLVGFHLEQDGERRLLVMDQGAVVWGTLACDPVASESDGPVEVYVCARVAGSSR